MILSSHYVIRDILHTVEHGEVEEVKKICRKYTDRYKNDKELVDVCSIVMESVEEAPDEQLNEMRLKLEDLLSVRRMDTTGGTGLWFADRRKVSR